jgi:hypothetical protein
MIELCWSDRLPKVVELAHNAIETGNYVHTRLVKLKNWDQATPFCRSASKIALFETIEQGEGVFEVLGLGEFLGLGILDASPH